MNFIKLILRNLIYYRRKHIIVVLGVTLSSAILIGALIIGDSVKYSLKKIVLNRLGKVQFALTSGDRMFGQDLGRELSERIDIKCSSILHTRGIIINTEENRRLNNIMFYGVDNHFDDLSPTQTNYKSLSSNEIAVNSYIASKLNLEIGDEVLLRFEKLDNMPKDSPLSDGSDITIAERFRIKSIASDEEFGRFGLRSEQIAPYNIFLPITKLANLMEMENSANLLLAYSKSDDGISSDQLNNALDEVWRIEDSGINLSLINADKVTELRSDRVFIDAPIVEAASKSKLQSSEILTYFVNEIKLRNKSTPYSFVSGLSSEDLNLKLGKNEIIINSWAAEDLDASIGSKLILEYFLVDANNNLSTDSSTFTVRQIVNIDGVFADKNLLPDYPGLAESESCLDWHPGIPIDFDKIRKKDEVYWEKFKGTPKAFISLDLAKEIWENRFGNITAIRFPTNDIDLVKSKLRESISPHAWNIQFNDVKKEGLEASEHSVDFAGLFFGLSFFVIISALLLTSIMVLFNLESRSQETGIFLGIGFNNGLIKKIIYSEIGILILIGSLLGCIVGVFYNNIILLALGTVWSDAVGTSALEVSVQPATIITGFMIVIIINFFTVWLSIRNKLGFSVHLLQRGIENLDFRKKGSKNHLIISLFTLLAAILLISTISPSRGSQVFIQYFFIGVLFLISGIAFASHLLRSSGSKSKMKILSELNLSAKELTRKRNRSLLLITLLGSSLFIVFTVGINKKNVDLAQLNNQSGTGGYTLFGETSVPIFENLNDLKIRKSFVNNYSDEKLKFIQLKVKSGDDASCLNLNRISNPQVIGVNPKEFNDRGAFTFASFSTNVDPDAFWNILEDNFSEQVIPGIADASVIQWQLGKSIGDTLNYIDDYGNEFNIVLVAGIENSIFQGNLLISETNFLKRFPSVNGSNIFITESSVHQLGDLSEQLNYSMQDYGLNLSATSERLAEFNKIENTYLSIFLILGSFGILIGSLGIGLVVNRNVQEQRSELALLQALGFTKGKILSIINTSYLYALIYGVAMGLIAAFAASIPTLIGTNSNVPYSLIVTIILLIVISGFGSIFLTAKLSLKENINEILRNE